MADVSDITPHLDLLDSDLDKLEDSLSPILTNLGEIASKLPLLDKAKLYVLATYSIETALFSSLRLNGTDAKKHPVFGELARVRQYYEKIKKAEEPSEQRPHGINMQAAIRFIKADLAGDNKKVDTKLKEQLAKERAKAAIQARMNMKRPAEDPDAASSVAELIAAESSNAADAQSAAASSAAEGGELDGPDRKKPRKTKGDKGRRKKKPEKDKKK